MSQIEYAESLPRQHDNYDSIVDNWKLRGELVRKYAWAIPNQEALATLAKFQPLVEIGAGTGYWAYELRKRGVKIDAYDQFPANGDDWTEEEESLASKASDEADKVIGKNWYHKGYPSWTEVLPGTPDILKTYSPEWNLFLCWPPMTDMAAYALGYHRGEYIVYVGEDSGGCSANSMFWRLLRRLYDHVESVAIPQWWGLHDGLDVYKKKGV